MNNARSSADTEETTTATAEAPPKAATILVVDDSRDTRVIAKKFFQRAELSCDTVDSAEAALDYLHERVPELICTDINMPGMGGLQLCHMLRKQESTKEIPIIVFTALSSSKPIGDAFSAGANDYVAKPLHEIELVSRARHHISEFHKRQRAQQRISNLSQLNETKNRFLGVASHDLRNPLVSIRGISQYLQSQRFGPLNEGQTEMISTIADTSSFMLTLVEDLLEISKLESSHFELKIEETVMAELVQNAKRLHQAAADRKKIHLSIDDRSEGATAPVDRKLITRVLDNLVSNALKFTFPETKVVVGIEASLDMVDIIVEDEGPGIPPDEFDRLFKEFSRTSSQPTGGESSSGIGLFIVRRIAQQHNASITAANRETGGARFTLSLPRY
ncbi:ATP-binding protein [Pelagicoccus sp. SDUM812003]|uniref:hybrid sensor histidine kinase/response regulator n=1 Tax=Pelagicoccus sp. SDUM812003 TaxID=3041267 RepID=UPI00280D53A1|nr:ATP-binding protein [Pelagicoccus sp. SDUM812003]MDQ8202287.1 response regulator [Pelagicoccus sp. SDUM812003]